MKKNLMLFCLIVGLCLTIPTVELHASEVQSPEAVAAAEPTDIVHFNDPDLEESIANSQYLTVGEITVADMADITYLMLDGGDISDLTGLEYAVNLTDLHANRNQISDLSPISGLTSLQTLELDENQISDLSPISGLTSLESLHLSQNQISDLSPISGLTAMSTLQLTDNQITDLTPISGFVNLTNISVENNQITDISALTNATKLVRVAIDHNQVTSIAPLANKPKLEYVLISFNAISDLSPLSGSPEIRTLNAPYNQISDLTPLTNLTELRILDLAGNQITDISPLSGLTNLTDLELNNNNTSDISPLSGLTKLNHLDLSRNPISDLTPLSNLTMLRELYLDETGISDLSPLSGLTELIHVSAIENQITDISPLGDLPNLQKVTAYNQEIELDPIVVEDDTPITYPFVKLDGSEGVINLGTPTLGTHHYEDDYGQQLNESVDVDFGGELGQTITYVGDSTITGDITATTSEETALSDEELIALFNVVSSEALTITVDQTAVDYSTPGDYQVTFTDEVGTTLTSTLTITDVLPTLTFDSTSATVSVGSTTDDVISQLAMSATEIADGDLTDAIIYDDSEVDYSTPGEYQLMFTVTDEEGNVVSQEITVTVTSEIGGGQDVGTGETDNPDETTTTDETTATDETTTTDETTATDDVTNPLTNISETDQTNSDEAKYEKMGLATTGSEKITVVLGLIVLVGVLLVIKSAVKK